MWSSWNDGVFTPPPSFLSLLRLFAAIPDSAFPASHSLRSPTPDHTTSAAPPAPVCPATVSNTPTPAFCVAHPPAAAPHAVASSRCKESTPPARSEEHTPELQS